MKKLLVIVALVGAVSFVSAQEKKNTYVKEGNLIKATLFYDNGQVSQEGYYTADGKLHGEWVSYDTDGKKTAVANYNEGKKTGKWFFWEDDTLREVDYSQSRITSVNTWKIEGERVVSND
ncbi:MAG: nicotinic acid mononucleotide adenyltransferase [Leeuwenhoekiella sp.]|uniref:Nicotinic acid mononucleotide adenyltransferase n=1 Tax=Leeuwenhoekiella nanhaiensis TaxID=1655491 RepID=A0A2G1VVU2_9FLAO|nr:nicotinic acid mononucleotide adenyltransferase [Leeuwenhoekiella nanhaiensis]PHQ30908.1 nicotinic acid mononucleotide adenyltransferase [Leeuwenhoekiella nanhaiensis]PHR99163.1 MAG: nicotinic acid mononucleotide adenyltransferase [Leeuwenhoekiella sp.]